MIAGTTGDSDLKLRCQAIIAASLGSKEPQAR